MKLRGRTSITVAKLQINDLVDQAQGLGLDSGFWRFNHNAAAHPVAGGSSFGGYDLILRMVGVAQIDIAVTMVILSNYSESTMAQVALIPPCHFIIS